MTDILGPASTNAVTTRPARTISRGANNTWFQDCSSPTSEDGTELGADWHNDVLAQFRTAFSSSGIAQDNADDMLWRAIFSAGVRFASDTGTANHIVVACLPAPVLALKDGLLILARVKAGNTGATDVTADGMPTKPLVYPTGSALGSGDLVTDGFILFAYDLKNDRYQLVAKGAASGSYNGSGAFIRRWQTQVTTAVPITVNFFPSGNLAQNNAMGPTDGQQVMSLTVTPQSNQSVFELNFTSLFGCYNAITSYYVFGTIIRDDGTVVAAGEISVGASFIMPLTMAGRDAPARSTPVTYYVRIGANSGPNPNALVDPIDMNGSPPASGSYNGQVGGTVAKLVADEIRS